ncbi:MAG: molybdate ABC transporter substrate-binding protein [Acidimicrobiia bacterium]|nr:molybdate ABC transporter substrate-binding protein [Acidimicrobiia bacterium]
MTRPERTSGPRPRGRRRAGALATVVALVVLAACGGASTPAATSAATPQPNATVERITVAAASDLRPAFEELGAHFEAETGTAVTFSFGSSGQLREQIVNGAPFDLFASANVAFVDDVIEAGRGDEETKADYALGRIVLWASDPERVPASVDGLVDEQYRRIAIANPEHAPYGLAAKQALESAGIYGAVADRLVYGENISDTFRIAESGNADVAIVALSLAVADGRRYATIPDGLHEPLHQALVVTSSGDQGAAAAAFAAFVTSPAGRRVMVRYGFTLPGEPEPQS